MTGMNTQAPTVAEFAMHDPDELAQQRAHAIADPLRDAIAARGHAMLAVSGGKLPIALFGQLLDLLNNEALTTLSTSASQRLAALPWPLDVAILGRGEDRHTASLFTGATKRTAYRQAWLRSMPALPSCSCWTRSPPLSASGWPDPRPAEQPQGITP